MPIPKPTEKETENEYIGRCISKIIDEYDQTQAAAICYSTWRKTKETMAKKEIYVLTPRKTENRGQYLKRCSSHPKVRAQMSNIKDRMGFCLNSFNEYYRYWSKIEEFADVPKDTALGECIAKEKAKGFDYKEAYAHCATKIGTKPLLPGESITLGEDLLVEPVMFNEMDILGYKTKYFYLCPGAQSTFEKLVQAAKSDDDKRMIRSAAVMADAVFEIEDDVLEEEIATPEQLERAKIIVDDFKNLMEVIDEQLGMYNDVNYMDGHIEKIGALVDEEMGLEDACWEGYEPIGTKNVGGKEVPNCVPIKEE